MRLLSRNGARKAGYLYGKKELQHILCTIHKTVQIGGSTQMKEQNM